MKTPQIHLLLLQTRFLVPLRLSKGNDTMQHAAMLLSFQVDLRKIISIASGCLT